MRTGGKSCATYQTHYISWDDALTFLDIDLGEMPETGHHTQTVIDDHGIASNLEGLC
jgi:hypothetical protein